MNHYVIEKQEYEGAPCDHPLCDQLHRRFMVDGVHYRHVREWVIVDTRTDQRAAATGIDDTYDTKREAQARLALHLAHHPED